MAAHQYVCDDVTSDQFYGYMTYYTDHREMASSQYVCVDVPSNYRY
jgi:hypothetical protein